MLDHRETDLGFKKCSKSGSLLYTYEQLTDKDFDFFSSLKISDRILLFNTDIEIAHSLKDNDRCYFDKNDEFIFKVFEEMNSHFFITAHAHRQYIKQHNGKTIINPGSIGIPREHGDLCQYAIIDIFNGNIDCSFYQIKYDLASAIKSQFQSGIIDYAKCWGISILYDIITGREFTMTLLNKVTNATKENKNLLYDEDLWQHFSNELGIKFSESEILSLI